MRAQPPPVSAGGLTPERRHAGRYALERELGRGGMATVYLAQDERHGRRVAVKVLRAELARELGAERFLKEIATVAPLRHPYIVPLFDSGDDEGVLYYVMPYVEGESLRERLTRERQLPVDAVLSIACDVAEALDCAHRASVVHRDVKPENVLLDGSHALVTDFGVAQAVAAAGSDRLTGSGMVVGTPAYMSPEQATGDTKVDARSDVYALGCVVYEMLAGEPPFAGPTRQAVLAKHANAPVPPLHIARPGIPVAAERAIEKALAKTPADRWATAGAFAGALEKALAPAVLGRETPRRRVWVMGGVVAAVLAVAATALMMSGSDSGADRDNSVAIQPPDTTRIIVFPLAREENGASSGLDDDLLHDALARWRGIVVVDRFQVADAIKQRGDVRTSTEAARLATSLGAGRYVRGGIMRRGDGLRVYAALFDVGRPQALHQASSELPRDPSAAAGAYARIADSLLVGGMNVADVPGAMYENRSLPALQAFARGQRALDEWDLATADEAFEEALGFYDGDVRTAFWLAQVRAWRDLATRDWVTLASRAASDTTQLPSRERRLAAALVYLAEHRYGEACRVYERLVARNSRDFAAWYGLGQCRTMDKTVLADSTSPSGWRFRSSYRRAVDAYTRAFELLPSVHRGYERGAFERLRVLLLVSRDLTNGYGPDSALFYGRAGLLADTLVLIPYPWQKILSSGSEAIPPGFAAALERQRSTFRRIAAGWSAAFPRSSGAKHAVALSLELLGDPAAIDTLRAARQLTADSARRFELATAEVLTRVKFGAPDDTEQLAAARLLADSLLGISAPSRAQSELLKPLAALRGQCGRLDALARSAGAPTSPITPKLWTDAQVVLGRNALGCGASPSVPTLAELDAAVRRFRSGANSPRWADVALLYRQALLAPGPDSAIIERLAAPGDYKLLVAARALARRDTAGARVTLTSFAAEWRDELGPPTPDVALPGAVMWLALRDTVMAVRWLDRTLDVAAYDPKTLGDQARVATFVRGMALRADLAMKQRDPRTARRWASAVATLWAGADRSLQPVVARMTAYATQ